MRPAAVMNQRGDRRVASASTRLAARLCLLAATMIVATVAQMPGRPANNSMALCSPDVGENYADGLFYLQQNQVVTLQADSSSPYRMSLNCTARFTADPSLTSGGTGYNLRIVYLNFYTDSSGGDKWTVLNDGVFVSSNFGDNRLPLPPSYTIAGAVLGLSFTSDASRSYTGVAVNISLVVRPSPTPTASPATATTTPSIPPTPSQTATVSKTSTGSRTASSTPVPSSAIVMCNSTAGSTRTQTVMLTAGMPVDIVTQPGNTTYPASAICQVTLVAPAGAGVRVLIRYSDIQAGADVLRIYDGATVAARQLYQVTSSASWSDILVDNSTSDTVLLSFTTDATLQYSGIRMVAEVAVQRPPSVTMTPTATVSRSFSPAAPGAAIEFCPTVNGTNATARAMRSLNLTLGANGVPMAIEAFTNTGPTYPLFIDCTLSVFGPPGTLVQGTVTYMRTTVYDATISLLDGPNASSPYMQSTSGIFDFAYNAPQAVFASSNVMTITFTADQGPPGGYGGIRISITAMAPTPSPSVTPSETPVPPSSIELCGRASGSSRYAVRQLDARGGGLVNGSSLTIIASALSHYPTLVTCGTYLLAAPGTRISARIVNLFSGPAPAGDYLVATSFDPISGGAGALASRQIVSAAGEYGYWFANYWGAAQFSVVVLPGLSPDISPGTTSGGVMRLNFSSGSGYGPVYSAGLTCVPMPCMGYRSYNGFTVVVDALPLPAWQDTICSPSARAASTVLSGGGGTVKGIVLPVGGSIDLTTTAAQPYGPSLTCALTIFAPSLPAEVARYAMWAEPGAAPAPPLNYTLRLRFEYAETEAPAGSASGDRFRIFDGPSTVSSPAVADIAGDASGTELGDIVASRGALHFTFSSDAANHFRGAKVHIDVLPVTSAGMSSATRTASATATASLSYGASASISATATTTRSSSGTATGSTTGTLSGTGTGTSTRTVSKSISMSATASLSYGASASTTATGTGTASGTFAASPTGVVGVSPSASSAVGMQQATLSPTASMTPTSPGAGGGIVVAGSDRPTQSPTVSATATPSEPLVPLRVVIRVSQSLANMPFSFFSDAAAAPAATAWLRVSVLAVRAALQPTIAGVAGARANITIMSVADTATGSSVQLSGSAAVNAARRRRLLAAAGSSSASGDAVTVDAKAVVDADARIAVSITSVTRASRPARALQGSTGCVITYSVAAELPMGSASSGAPALAALANAITSPSALAAVSAAINAVLVPLETSLSLTPGSLSAPAAGASASVVSYSTAGATASPAAGSGGGNGGSSSDLPLGAVVGGAVGGLLVIGVIVALYIRRGKQGSGSRGSKTKAGKGKAGLSNGGSDDADLFVTNPYRGQAGLARGGAGNAAGDGDAILPAKPRNGGVRASLAPTTLGV